MFDMLCLKTRSKSTSQKCPAPVTSNDNFSIFSISCIFFETWKTHYFENSKNKKLQLKTQKYKQVFKTISKRPQSSCQNPKRNFEKTRIRKSICSVLSKKINFGFGSKILLANRVRLKDLHTSFVIKNFNTTLLTTWYLDYYI